MPELRESLFSFHWVALFSRFSRWISFGRVGLPCGGPFVYAVRLPRCWPLTNLAPKEFAHIVLSTDALKLHRVWRHSNSFELRVIWRHSLKLRHRVWRHSNSFVSGGTQCPRSCLEALKLHRVWRPLKLRHPSCLEALKLHRVWRHSNSAIVSVRTSYHHRHLFVVTCVCTTADWRASRHNRHHPHAQLARREEEAALRKHGREGFLLRSRACAGLLFTNTPSYISYPFYQRRLLPPRISLLY